MKTLSLLLISLLVVSAHAQAGCKPLSTNGYTVSFSKDDGLEITSPDGTKTVLEIEDATRPECETLTIAEGKDHGSPLAELVYYPGESGTKVMIDDKNYILIDIRNKALATDAITLEEVQRRPLHEDHSVVNKISWKKTNGAMVLEKTDVETKEVTQVWPEAKTTVPSASPTLTPGPTATTLTTPETPERTAPEGTSDI